MNNIILFQFVQNTTDYEDNIAVIAPELSDMIKEIEKKVGAFKVLQLDQQQKMCFFLSVNRPNFFNVIIDKYKSVLFC